MKDLPSNTSTATFLPTVVYTVMVIPCIAVAWGIGQAMKREKATKEERILDKFQATHAGTLVKSDQVSLTLASSLNIRRVGFTRIKRDIIL
jgi:hypothetical protein